MSIVAAGLVALVALIHVYILVLEMFLWRTSRGRQAFGTTPEQADTMATLAANQGLYNGFLAAGLGLSLVIPEPSALYFKVFFLGCVIIAGVVRRPDGLAADPGRPGAARRARAGGRPPRPVMRERSAC